MIIVEYTATKLPNYDKAYKPAVYVNGKWVYTISHSAKTMRGGIAKAKKIAENMFSNNPDVIIKERKIGAIIIEDPADYVTQPDDYLFWYDEPNV